MIDALLGELENALKHNNLWSETAPSTLAFASSAPFCFDTMRFEQWLQFVFIFKLRQLLEIGQALPTGAKIAPMGEHVLTQYEDIVAILRKIDEELK